MERSYEDENNRNITWFLGGNTYSKPRSEKKLAADQQDNRGICTGRTEKGSSANDAEHCYIVDLQQVLRQLQSYGEN